jgi:hypothetical protein
MEPFSNRLLTNKSMHFSSFTPIKFNFNILNDWYLFWFIFLTASCVSCCEKYLNLCVMRRFRKMEILHEVCLGRFECFRNLWLGWFSNILTSFILFSILMQMAQKNLYHQTLSSPSIRHFLNFFPDF